MPEVYWTFGLSNFRTVRGLLVSWSLDELKFDPRLNRGLS